MFVGISKNLGNGIRVGLGTKVGSSPKKIKDKDFLIFLNKCQQDLIDSLCLFVQANGDDINLLIENKVDLDVHYVSNPKYKEFESLSTATSNEIEKIIYSGDTGVIAKRKITESIFTVKDFMASTYPNETLTKRIKNKQKSLMVKFLLGVGIAVIPYIFYWFSYMKGFSKTYRVISTLWLIIYTLAASKGSTS